MQKIMTSSNPFIRRKKIITRWTETQLLFNKRIKFMSLLREHYSCIESLIFSVQTCNKGEISYINTELDEYISSPNSG